MSSSERQQRIAALRHVIADIERKPALEEARERVQHRHDRFPVLAGGLLQEIFTDDRRNAGASLGFALAQAKGLLDRQRLAIFYLHLAQEGQAFGIPYGPGLISFGLDPADLIHVRASSMSELLWAAEEALACRAVAAVVADIAASPKQLNFTASRRLSLRAAQAGTSLFMLRYGQAREASAAHLRWRLMPTASARHRYDDKAPGPLRWLAHLERGTIFKQQTTWLLGWSENGFTTFPAGRGQFATPTVPQPFSAQLADRLSQTA